MKRTAATKLIRMKRVEGDATVALAEQGGRTVVVLSDRSSRRRCWMCRTARQPSRFMRRCNNAGKANRAETKTRRWT